MVGALPVVRRGGGCSRLPRSVPAAEGVGMQTRFSVITAMARAVRALHQTSPLHEFRNSCMRIQITIHHAHHGMDMELVSLLRVPRDLEMCRHRSPQTVLRYRPA